MLVAFFDDNHDRKAECLVQAGFVVHDSKLRQLEELFVEIDNT